MSAYVYRKPVRRTRHVEFRRRMLTITAILMPFIAVGAYVYFGLRNSKPVQPVTSAIENSQITGNKTTFFSDYFQFQDSDTWVLDKNNSTANKLTYHSFRKNVQEAQMVIYINQVPIPLYLATPRVLPVRIVNTNRLMATTVSNPCGLAYAKGEPHTVKEMSVAGTTMLCDPDSPQYYLVLGEVGGNYQLHLKRPNGTPIQFVITYQDTSLSAQPDSILSITNSFQTR